MAKKAYVNDGTNWVELASATTDLSGYLTQSSASTIYQPIVANISDTEIGYLNNASANIQTQLNSKANLSGATFSGNITAPEVHATTKLVAETVGGDEGGEILLGKPATNSTIAGNGVTIDVYQNKLRIFEQGGDARGASLDMSTLANGVSSTIAVPGISGVPYRMSAGTTNFASISIVSNGSAFQAVTFPTDRFTTTPIVTATIQNAPGGSGNLVPRAINVTATGFNMYLYNPGSVTQTSSNVLVAWQAIQMTSGASAG